MDKIEELVSKINIGLKEVVKEQIEAMDLEFRGIINETRARKEWFKAGRCYHCGGKVEALKPNSLDSVFLCSGCGKNVNNDALFEYYYNPIIKRLLALSEKV